MPHLPEITTGEDQAIRDAIGAYIKSPIVTEYVLVARSIGADGGPELSVVTSPDITAWDKIGLLRSILVASEQQFAYDFNDNDD